MRTGEGGMGDMSKRRPDPNATIQLDLDALNQVELVDNDPIPQPSPPASGERSPRLTPPPLPASTVTTAPPARRSAGRTAASALIVLVVVAAAIAGGLFFGARMRAQPSPAATPSVVAPPTASAAPSASTLVLPTVEIGKH
jgi:hypothetical protein